MSKLSGAMWNHIPNPSMFPKWIPVDMRVSEGNLSIISLCSLPTQSVWRKIRSDSQPNKHPFLTFKPNRKTFSLHEISEDKTAAPSKVRGICSLVFQILESLESQVAVYLLNTQLVTVQPSLQSARPHSSCS